MLELGDESLELLVDLTWLIAGGLGAARFFILFGGVEALEDDDSDWPDTELTWGLVGLGGLSGGWSGCTMTFGKKAEGWIRVFSKLILDRSTLAISSPFSRLPIFETLIRSCGRKSYLIHWTKVVFTLANRFHYILEKNWQESWDLNWYYSWNWKNSWPFQNYVNDQKAKNSKLNHVGNEKMCAFWKYVCTFWKFMQFFCLSDFTWNQFWGNWNVEKQSFWPFYKLRIAILMTLGNFSVLKFTKLKILML